MRKKFHSNILTLTSEEITKHSKNVKILLSLLIITTVLTTESFIIAKPRNNVSSLYAEQQKRSILSSIITKTIAKNDAKKSPKKLIINALKATASITTIPDTTKDLTSSKIHSTINTLIQQRKHNEYTMGLFGEKIPKPQVKPITLIHPTISNDDNHPTLISDLYKVRTCTHEDDVHIANLRLSVFSSIVSSSQNSYFQKKSCDIINNRRNLFHSICLVVTIPTMQYNLVQSFSRNVQHNGSMKQYVSKRYLDNIDDVEDDWIIGSLECSFHEFDGTKLGKSQPKGKLMYITEVAVSPFTRRCGIGTKLLQGMEELARLKNIKTLYLHVETINKNAFHMYTKFGFYVVLGPVWYTKYTKNSLEYDMYKEFSARLNLYNEKDAFVSDDDDGVKYYYLMRKDLCYDEINECTEEEIVHSHDTLYC